MSDFLKSFNDLDRTIPDIRVELPYSGKEILMRPFNTKEQMSIVKAIEKEDFDLVHLALDELLKNCVLNADFNIDDLVSKERDLLLINLRIESVSEDFTFYWDCDNKVKTDGKEHVCGKRNTKSVNLDSLKLDELQGDMETTISLKDKECDITFGVSYRGKEKEATEYINKKNKELGEGSELNELELVNVIYATTIRSVKIGENLHTELNLDERLEIIESMHLDDRKSLESFADNIKGLEYNMKQEVKCSKCENTRTEEMEWVAFFTV